MVLWVNIIGKMVLKKISHTYKKTFTRTDGKHEPEDHHIAAVVILMGLIIILMSGVIYFLLQDKAMNEQLITELVYNNPNSNDYSYYRYSMSEFERVAQRPISSVDEMEQYLLAEEFDTVAKTEDGSSISGRKGGGCYEDKYRLGTVCRTLQITYSPANGDFVEMIVYRDLLPQ